MNNFELMAEAQILSDTKNKFIIAKELVQVKALNREMYNLLVEFLPEYTIDEDGNDVYYGGSFQWSDGDCPLINEVIEITNKAKEKL